MFLPHELVDLIVQVADLVVGERDVLDSGNLAGDFFEDLATPFLAGGDGCLLGDGAGTAGSACVNDSEVGGLGFAEAEEHGLGFFGVARLGGGGGTVSELPCRIVEGDYILTILKNWRWPGFLVECGVVGSGRESDREVGVAGDGVADIFKMRAHSLTWKFTALWMEVGFRAG